MSCLLLRAVDASAQEPAPAESTPPPLPAPRVDGAPAAPPRRVRIHVHEENNLRRIRTEVTTSEGKFQVVCVSVDTTPAKPGAAHRPFRKKGWGECVGDVAPGSQLVITIGDRELRKPFIVPDDPGGEVEIRILPPDRGERTPAAIAMFVVGGASAVGGVFAYELASIGGGNTTTPVVAMLAGAAFVVGGIIVIASGSREPRIELGEQIGPRAVRRDDVLGDVAEDRRREATPPAMGRAPVVGYTLSF